MTITNLFRFISHPVSRHIFRASLTATHVLPSATRFVYSGNKRLITQIISTGNEESDDGKLDLTDDDYDTVCFNVNDTIFKVASSLLKQYPDTKLAQMVFDNDTGSDEEGEEDSKEEETEKENGFLVARDGKRFKYIVDYMENGPEMTLPVTISKANFLSDLQYFGFDLVEPDFISGHVTHLIYSDLTNEMNQFDDDVTARVASELSERKAQLMIDEEYSNLARYCFLRFKFSGNLIVDFNIDVSDQFYRPEHRKYKVTQGYNEGENQFQDLIRHLDRKQNYVSLNKYLGNYGFKCKHVEYTGERYSKKQFKSTIYLEVTE